MNAKRKSAFLKPFVATVVLSAGSLFYNEVHAQTVKEQPPAEEKTALMVDFKGTKNEFLVFDVNLNQSDERKTVLRITDQDRYQLYYESFFKNNIHKRILIPADDIEKVTFSLYSSKGEVKKAFTVEYELKETVLVKELANK